MKLRKKKVLDNFTSMIRIRTVSSEEGNEELEGELLRFRALLKERYPHVFRAGEHFLIGNGGLLIRIPGMSAEKPSVLMAHMDVVSADAEGWRHDPFAAVIEDGRVYGRGTLDTKASLCAIMEAAEYCLADGYVPRRDLYLSFGAEEEIEGPCCAEIVSFLKERGVRPDFVLDEGGAVIPEGLPGIRGEAAMIAVAEKGVANFSVSIASGEGGHAATPPKSTVAGRLARAACEIEKHPFPARLSTPSRMMFRELAPHVPPLLRPVFARPEKVAPLILMAAPYAGRSTLAMVRSTTAITCMKSGSSFNVLPDQAEMNVNVRLLEGDTLESAERHLSEAVSDPDAKVRCIKGSNPSRVSDIDCSAYETLASVIREIWPGAVIAPYQMNGGTDARFYQEITNHIYRFLPMRMTAAERATVHGRNESIAVNSLLKMIVFYIRLIQRL